MNVSEVYSFIQTNRLLAEKQKLTEENKILKNIIEELKEDLEFEKFFASIQIKFDEER